MDADSAYRAAFTDWLACACAGADERAAGAVRASGADLIADVAFAASRLLDMPPPQRENAIALGLLRAGGTRGVFGSDGKAIQVGLAAAAGVQAALLAHAGATVDRRRAIHGPLGFAAVLGASWP